MLFPFDKRGTQDSEAYHLTQSMDYLSGHAHFSCMVPAVRDSNFIIFSLFSRFQGGGTSQSMKAPRSKHRWRADEAGVEVLD